MEGALILYGLLGVVVLICIIVCAVKLTKIEVYLKAMASEKGYDGNYYVCGSCKKKFQHKLKNCPHCKTEINYGN